MNKVSLRELLDSLVTDEYWTNRYKTFVPTFIEEAKRFTSCKQWDKTVFNEYFECQVNCVSSLKQGDFTKEEKVNIKANWETFSGLLKELAINQDKPNFDCYNKIVEEISKYTKTPKFAPIYRMIAGLQPHILCNIIARDRLKKLLKNLDNLVFDEVPQYNTYFESSYNFLQLVKLQYPEKKYEDLITLAWLLIDKIDSILKNKDSMIVNENLKIDVNSSRKLYCSLLENNHNLILTGAPGTGKTYLAKEIAKQLIGTDNDHDKRMKLVQFHPSLDYTDFVEGLRAEETENGDTTFKLHNGVFKEFCKNAIKTECNTDNFESLYDDFISNEVANISLVTPTLRNAINFEINSKKNFKIKTEKTEFVVRKELIYEYVMNGVAKDWKPYTTAIGDKFKELYSDKLKSLNNNSKINNDKFVFIIDEINRGEISKIFGELFYSIDPGYRGVKGKVTTQYANLHSHETETIFDEKLGKGYFYVPENVYIIGTMNDIDRSVESMDFAMRRRFVWKEIKSIDRIDMWESADWVEEAEKRMCAINAKIEKIEGLGSSYHIGPAYFLKLENYKEDGSEKWNSLWNYHIEPLISEYLRGMPDAEKLIIEIKGVYNNPVETTSENSNDVNNKQQDETNTNS